MRSQDTYTLNRQLLEMKRLTAVSGGIGTAVSLLCLGIAATTPTGLQKTALFGMTAAMAWSSKKLVQKRMELGDIHDDLEGVNRRETMVQYREAILEPKQNVVNINNGYAPNWVEQNLVRDFMTYWLGTPAKRHLLVIAGTGGGKSTFIKGILQQLPRWNEDWIVKAYDVDATRFDYGSSIHYFRKYSDIEAQMLGDIQELDNRADTREQVGDQGFNRPPMFLIAEELPAMVNEIKSEPKWIASVAKRGRKVWMLCAAVAQNDTVKNLGMEGDIGIRDTCFIRIYLGLKAVEQAKKLKNPQLENWLKEKQFGRFLVDDLPCEWFINTTAGTPLPPLPFAELPLSRVEAKKEERSKLDGTKFSAQKGSWTSSLSDLYTTRDKALKLHGEGLSVHAIIKRIWNCDGGKSYSKYKSMLETWIQELQTHNNVQIGE